MTKVQPLMYEPDSLDIARFAVWCLPHLSPPQPSPSLSAAEREGEGEGGVRRGQKEVDRLLGKGRPTIALSEMKVPSGVVEPEAMIVATCSCGSGIPVARIRVNGRQVELIALPAIFDLLREEGRQPGDGIADELMTEVGTWRGQGKLRWLNHRPELVERVDGVEHCSTRPSKPVREALADLLHPRGA